MPSPPIQPVDPDRNEDGAARLSGFIYDEADDRRMHNAGRSDMVRKLRLALPLAAGLIVAFMFIWSKTESIAPPQRKEKVAPQAIGKNELLNPRFESEDASQQPYTITAKTAVQNAADMDMILLDGPVARIELKNKDHVAVQAVSGEFGQEKRTLLLKGDVRLSQNDGYVMKTDAVRIDIAGEKAVSENPVFGEGPAGTIQSQGMTADGKTGIITFTGPARMTLTKSAQTDAKDMP